MPVIRTVKLRNRFRLTRKTLSEGLGTKIALTIQYLNDHLKEYKHVRHP